MAVNGTTRIYLIRHGETELNQNTPGYCGWTDIPLNSKGRAQADATAYRLQGEGLAVVLSSDLTRARDTASVLAQQSQEPVVQADARFREMNYGLWEGKSEEQLEAEDPHAFLAWKDDPARVPARGGETLRQVLDRAVPALEQWAERHKGETLALVSHKTAIRVLLCWVLGAPLGEYSGILQQNGALNLIERRGERWVIASVNDTCHLPGDLCSPAV